MAKRDSYHHGSLREALLAAALRILEQEGSEALTLRKVAAEVGVSHAAPAHHFPALKHLWTALAAIGFARFDQSMRRARAEAQPGPEHQLRAAAKGYIDHARANPALFRLMFTAPLLDWDDPELCRHAQSARQQLSDICAPASDHLGMNEPAQRQAVEEMVWAQIHGYAHLHLDRELPLPDLEGKPMIDIAGLIFRVAA
jgi:AcrR family transcriptional regulator